jgi:glycerol-3-phosphate acyltransferase PlsY
MDILPTLLYTLGFALFGYLCGSLPFAIWITRLFEGVDVREAGSGHAAAEPIRWADASCEGAYEYPV